MILEHSSEIHLIEAICFRTMSPSPFPLNPVKSLTSLLTVPLHIQTHTHTHFESIESKHDEIPSTIADVQSNIKVTETIQPSIGAETGYFKYKKRREEKNNNNLATGCCALYFTLFDSETKCSIFHVQLTFGLNSSESQCACSRGNGHIRLFPSNKTKQQKCCNPNCT